LIHGGAFDLAFKASKFILLFLCNIHSIFVNKSHISWKPAC